MRAFLAVYSIRPGITTSKVMFRMNTTLPVAIPGLMDETARKLRAPCRATPRRRSQLKDFKEELPCLRSERAPHSSPVDHDIWAGVHIEHRLAVAIVGLVDETA
jgi:hypothetical protein